MTNNLIKTESFSAQMRSRAIKKGAKELLVARLSGSSQEEDLTEPTNCNGVGRVRHFRRATSPGWPTNPLPIDPAAHKLGLPTKDVERAQVFQNAACNWRCWYCYVPFSLLNGDEQRGVWTTTDEMVRLYSSEPNAPAIIDLSGGQPDLTPEWIPWMMDSLERTGLSNRTYLWSDDNLSTDYFWTKLSAPEIDRVIAYRNYGKVGCFKGFDATSFSFNTRAEPNLFESQFDLFEKTVRLGIDVYGYATFTSPDESGIDERMKAFVDRLQAISQMLPLRVVPLRVSSFRPVESEERIKSIHEKAMVIQEHAIQCWNAELVARFTDDQRKLPIYEVAIR